LNRAGTAVSFRKYLTSQPAGPAGDDVNEARMNPGPKQCARCGASFLCKVDDLPHCQCVGVNVAPDLLAQLSESYSDCLCSRCLKELSGKEREADVVLSDA
jgi:hypothetical protein